MSALPSRADIVAGLFPGQKNARLKEEADAKRAALARAEKAEQRIAELEHEMAQLRWWHLG